MPPYCCPMFCRILGIGCLIAALVSFLLLHENTIPRSVAQAKRTPGTWPTFGGSKYRNMVNTAAKNVPTKWHVEGGKLKNIKWMAKLGTRSYGGPVIANGKVFVGTNNGQPRDPNIKGPKGVVMCFNEKDGKFLWQNVHAMPPAGIVRDALNDGLCSTPTIDGDRLYYVTPASKVVCAATSNGKIIWQLDMMKELKVVPNYVSNCSPLVVGDTLYVVTGNGTDAQGKLVSPKAPSFLALNKKDGSVKWKSNLPGANIIEGQWSNPAWAEADGKGQVIFPGGDCWLYALEPDSGKLIWKFHCNSNKDEAAQKKSGVPNYIVSTPTVHDGRVYIGVGLYPQHPAGNKVGHFWCVDLAKATKFGKMNKDHDVSPQKDNFDPSAAANKNSALAWQYGGELNPRPKFGRSVYFGRTISTAAVHKGLVYISEEYGYLHCLDAKTGKHYWEFDFRTGIWGSPVWADGKIYIGTEDGDVFIFAEGKEKKKIGEPIYMEEPVQAAPVIVGSNVYIMAKTKLYAIGAK